MSRDQGKPFSQNDLLEQTPDKKQESLPNPFKIPQIFLGKRLKLTEKIHRFFDRTGNDLREE